MGVLVQMINTACVYQRRTPFNPMNSIAFFQQQFCKISSILSGYTGN